MDFNEEEELKNELESEEFANDNLANPYYDEGYNEKKFLDLENSYFEGGNLRRKHLLKIGKFEAPIDNAKSQMKKKIFFALIKSPVFWVILGIGILVFLAILIFQMDWDLYGVSEPKPKYYNKAPSCGKVYFTWEKESYTKEHQKDPDYKPITNPELVDLNNEERFEYKEYEYDEYIAGIIWNDNTKAMDIDNEIVYQAMAIAARSRLIANLPDNCVVLKYYNEQAQSFEELTGNEPKYEDITNAIHLSKGIIIGRKGEIISAKYDPFSYIKKRMGEDNYHYFYHMMNENKESHQIIPAKWVDELEKKKGKKIPKEHVSSTKKLESMSLYGAKYLLEKVDSQYELYRILEEYYGRDIEYYTIDPNASFIENNYYGTSGCMWWPIGSQETTLENGVTMAKGAPSAMKISSPFGYRNLSLPGASTNHKAIDISGGGLEGVHNIIAAADGTVIGINTGCVAGDKSCGGSLGNYIKIQHSDGTITRYGHLYSVSISNGANVKQGQVIGKMGNTGNSTGVHLDFQVIVNGVPVNPLNYVSVSNPRKQCLGSVSDSFTGTGNLEFIEFIAKYAVEDMHSSGILASVTIAQAILESNWGKSTLSKEYGNYFGIKASSSWSGKVVELPTTECDADGNCYRTTALWRVYDNPLQSLGDHSNLLHNSRYNGVVGEKNYYTAITIIKNGGYATDPNYVNKISNLIEMYNLTRFDQM